MTQRDRIIQWTAYGIALLLVVAAERLFLNRLPVYGVTPVLLPLTLSACAVLEGPRDGAGFGIAVGALMSAAAGGGFWRLAVCSAAGFLCGLIVRHLLPLPFAVHLLCSALFLGIRMVWCIVIHLMAGTAEAAVLFRVALPEFLWSLVFAAPVYLLFRFICNHWGATYYN